MTGRFSTVMLSTTVPTNSVGVLSIVLLVSVQLCLCFYFPFDLGTQVHLKCLFNYHEDQDVVSSSMGIGNQYTIWRRGLAIFLYVCTLTYSVL